MAIKTVDKLNLSTNVINGIGLCYFDPETEQLNEFGSQEVLYITPFEESVRRYYLVKNSDFIDNKKPASRQVFFKGLLHFDLVPAAFEHAAVN